MMKKLGDSEMEVEIKNQAATLLDSDVVLCSDLGTSDACMKTTTIRNLVAVAGGRLNCMVFLADMSEMEQKAVSRWS